MRSLVLLLALAGLAAQAPPSLDTVLERAGAYVERFEEAFSLLVAEEQFRQSVRGAGGRSARFRETRSDFLLVKSPDGEDVIPFRDVFEVDGRPVRERENRLLDLFLNPSGDAFDQARRVNDESARFNIGPVTRTVNVPTLALKFLHPDYVRRSAFYREDETTVDGLTVWEMGFQEITVPTLVRTTDNESLPAEGTLWIDPETGIVVRSVIRLATGALRSEVEVTFGVPEDLDADLGIRVPVSLRERHRLAGGDVIEGNATYSRLRRFQVTTAEVVP